jgi:hypothetical protein
MRKTKVGEIVVAIVVAPFALAYGLLAGYLVICVVYESAKWLVRVW